ncbi:MAG TPA: maleylpyruvate isomerase family mycothiol-dependent enzyme [Nocardioidaceae bacterium]|nr:maleylpyruvate isomerase family mycothiol-dependent enzyme [Nocardioidaceae bacterium]
MTSEQARLGGYIDAWKSAVDDTLLLLRSLDPDDWSLQTDLPGWDVRAVAAHLAHLESELAGFEQTVVEVPELAHIRSPMGSYTELGPLARAGWAPDAIIDELERAVRVRLAELREHPPTDGSADPPRTPDGIGWSWETLLRNRPLDVWMHEQDIRRAVRRPGNLDTPGARHTAAVFAKSFGYSVGKGVAPPAGTTVVLDVLGAPPLHLAVQVNDDGRAVLMPADPDNPTVSLRMDLETFTVLGGGRRPAETLEVEVTGDEQLGRRVLAAMAVTP